MAGVLQLKFCYFVMPLLPVLPLLPLPLLLLLLLLLLPLPLPPHHTHQKDAETANDYYIYDGIIMILFIFTFADVIGNFLLTQGALITHGLVTLENINDTQLFGLELLYIYHAFYALIRILRSVQGSKKYTYKFIDELIVIQVA